MIHYHGTPITGNLAEFALAGKHAMVSYARPDQIEIVAELCQSFALDNGAFTTWKAGTQYDVEGFAELVQQWYRHPGFDWYIVPDVIDGTEQDNIAMQGKWFNLVHSNIYRHGVPVWHLHESLDHLRYLVNTHSRVAFGSSGEYAIVGSAGWWARMSEAMSTATDDAGIPLCKLHGLRMLDPTIFSQLPLASADSTNVARNIGIDSKWRGTYTPKSKRTRALILMERIENHAAASRWCGTNGIQQNLELFG